MGLIIREVVRPDIVVDYQVVQGEAGSNEPRNWHRRLRNVFYAAKYKIQLLLISVQCRHLLESPPLRCNITFLFFLHFLLKLGFRF